MQTKVVYIVKSRKTENVAIAVNCTIRYKSNNKKSALWKID